MWEKFRLGNSLGNKKDVINPIRNKEQPNVQMCVLGSTSGSTLLHSEAAGAGTAPDTVLNHLAELVKLVFSS